jgi:hypothetical protein
MRTTIRMNEELARRAKEHAAKTHRTFTELVEQAMTRLLAAEKTKARQPRIVLPTFGDPKKRITGEELQAAIERADLEYDLKKAGLERGDVDA